MIRVAVIADTHADESNRFDEHQRVMNWCAEDFAARNVAIALHAGDVFEATSTPRERGFVVEWTQRVADRCPLVFAAGNHDRPLDVAWLARLRSRFDIIADERPAVHFVAGVAVATLPWPRKAHLLASIGRAVSPEESGVLAADALRDIVRGLALELDGHPGPRVLLAHAMVDGARTDHNQPLVGLDMSVSAQDLALSRAHFVAVGHVHAENSWDIGGVPVVYPGAPMHHTFGDVGPTGYVVVDFDESGRLLNWERVPTPARQMLLCEMEYRRFDMPVHGEEMVHVGDSRMSPEIAKGAEVRLRYSCSSEHRDGAKRAAQMLRDDWMLWGAYSVRIEERVLATSRARAPEIARARTTADKLQAYWAATGKAPDDARRASLLAKLAELDAAT